jgi:hypothetical protein
MMRTRTAVLVVAVGLGAVALGACSSGSSSSTTTTSTAASATTSPPTSTPGAPSASSTTTTSPGGPNQCPTPKLTASVYGSSGAAGTIEVTMALTSAAASSCTLGGYPGLQMLNAAGTALPTTVVRKGNYPFTAMAPTVVTVAPGQAVYFNLGYSDVPSGTETSCPTSATVQVTPPNSYTSTPVSAQLSPCDNGSLTVSPVFAATGPSAQTRAPVH